MQERAEQRSDRECKHNAFCHVERSRDISNYYLPWNIERFLDFARNDKLEKTSPVHIWEQVILSFTLCEKIAIDLAALKLIRQLCKA